MRPLSPKSNEERDELVQLRHNASLLNWRKRGSAFPRPAGHLKPGPGGHSGDLGSCAGMDESEAKADSCVLSHPGGLAGRLLRRAMRHHATGRRHRLTEEVTYESAI